MSLTITLSPEAVRWATDRAALLGEDVSTYVARLVEQVAGTSPSLDEVLAPVRQAFAESGMTDDELGDLLEDAKHAARAGRGGAAASHG